MGAKIHWREPPSSGLLQGLGSILHSLGNADRLQMSFRTRTDCYSIWNLHILALIMYYIKIMITTSKNRSGSFFIQNSLKSEQFLCLVIMQCRKFESSCNHRMQIKTAETDWYTCSFHRGKEGNKASSVGKINMMSQQSFLMKLNLKQIVLLGRGWIFSQPFVKYSLWKCYLLIPIDTWYEHWSVIGIIWTLGFCIWVENSL